MENPIPLKSGLSVISVVAKARRHHGAAIRQLNRVRNTHPPWIRDEHTPRDVIRLYRQKGRLVGNTLRQEKVEEEYRLLVLRE